MTRVLVVDDSPVDRRLAGGLLESQAEWQVDYAANGLEALEQLAVETSDIVVTDLQMPELNGLELVAEVRRRFPLVPVILMTGQGSEDIAVAALEQGAASYVPKANLAHALLDTVEHVLGAARAGRQQATLLEGLKEATWRFELENDPALIPALVDVLQEQLKGFGLVDDTGRVRLAVALEEALLNALYHGNLELKTEELRAASSGVFEPGGENLVEQRRQREPYRSRRLHVTARLTPAEAQFVIRDEGPGFDPASLPEPGDPSALERQTGRGLVLMRTFLDEVRFNARGNEVTLVKRAGG